MASKKELVVIAAMLLLEEDDEEVKEKKRIWSRHWLLERKKGYFGQLLPDLAAHDTPGFEKFMRMDFRININAQHKTRKRAITKI